ncbi:MULTISPECIES: hypothetical protein [unclassified Sphingomonas]|uniref:hypothetical protein n=1 Tax=unclassified Sphingomonas TaxID=196159 RepID=UPI0025ED6B73|nr:MULTISPECIES: hypothetical protein [unclassified Sphingomonas]
MSTETPTSSQTVQRVRVGLIGLAAVVLLIGLASAIFSAASREKPVAAVDAPKAEAVANMTLANSELPAAAPNEPLAELGVAPATANGAAPAAPRQ